MERQTTLEVRNLNVYFKTAGGNRTQAVRNLSFQVGSGELLGIVGESGCGKSVSSLAIMGLLEFPAIAEADKICLMGTDISKNSREEMRKLRGSELSMIFQEPMTSLNPLFTIGAQLSDTIALHQECGKAEAKRRAVEMLEKVGIPRAEAVYKSYPNELSGGMRQRVMIALAFSCSPKLLIADEPTTALDVTIQAQILDLIQTLKERNGMTALFVTHDLGVVAEIAQRVIVMYAGRVVEDASCGELFSNPLHPYTSGLLRCIPRIDDERDTLDIISGQVPTPDRFPTGCRFHPRCPMATELCAKEAPPLSGGEDHRVACHLYASKG